MINRVFDSYIVRNVLNFSILILFLLIFLSWIIKFFDELRKVGHGDYSVLSVIIYTVLCLPKDIEIFFPMSSLLGTVLSVGLLISRNELLVMYSFGISALEIIFSVMKAVVVMIFVVIIFCDQLVPQSICLAHNYRTKKMSSGIISNFVSKQLWLKDDNSLIFIKEVSEDNTLLGVNIYVLDKVNRLKIIRTASRALYCNDYWLLEDVHDFCFDNSNFICKKSFSFDKWITDFNYNDLCKSILFPYSFSFFDLYNYLQYLNRTGQNTGKYRLIFLNKLFLPLSIFVIIVMSLSLVLSILFYLELGLKIIISVILGFFFLCINTSNYYVKYYI